MRKLWNAEITLRSIDADALAVALITFGMVAMFGAMMNRETAPAVFMLAGIMCAFGLWIMPNAVYLRGRRIR